MKKLMGNRMGALARSKCEILNLIDYTSYVEKLKNKKRVFKEQTQSTKTLFTTMVTTYGVKKNAYYLSSVDNQLTMDDFFVKI